MCWAEALALVIVGLSLFQARLALRHPNSGAPLYKMNVIYKVYTILSLLKSFILKNRWFLLKHADFGSTVYMLGLGTIERYYEFFVYTVCPGSSDPFYIGRLLYKMGHYFLDIL